MHLYANGHACKLLPYQYGQITSDYHCYFKLYFED